MNVNFHSIHDEKMTKRHPSLALVEGRHVVADTHDRFSHPEHYSSTSNLTPDQEARKRHPSLAFAESRAPVSAPAMAVAIAIGTGSESSNRPDVEAPRGMLEELSQLSHRVFGGAVFKENTAGFTSTNVALEQSHTPSAAVGSIEAVEAAASAPAAVVATTTMEQEPPEVTAFIAADDTVEEDSHSLVVNSGVDEEVPPIRRGNEDIGKPDSNTVAASMATTPPGSGRRPSILKTAGIAIGATEVAGNRKSVIDSSMIEEENRVANEMEQGVQKEKKDDNESRSWACAFCAYFVCCWSCEFCPHLFDPAPTAVPVECAHEVRPLLAVCCCNILSPVCCCTATCCCLGGRGRTPTQCLLTWLSVFVLLIGLLVLVISLLGSAIVTDALEAYTSLGLASAAGNGTANTVSLDLSRLAVFSNAGSTYLFACAAILLVSAVAGMVSSCRLRRSKAPLALFRMRANPTPFPAHAPILLTKQGELEFCYGCALARSVWSAHLSGQPGRCCALVWG